MHCTGFPLGSVRKFAQATFHKDLELSKKSARLAIKLRYKEKKKELVGTCEVFVAIIAAVS